MCPIRNMVGITVTRCYVLSKQYFGTGWQKYSQNHFLYENLGIHILGDSVTEMLNFNEKGCLNVCSQKACYQGVTGIMNS